MNMPVVSVIMPVYNVEPFIRHSIESVLSQDMPDIELILVDDGSTDNSGDICDEYARQDKRIKVIHQANKGVSGARNSGLENVSSELICFVDPDDWVEPDYVSNMLKFAPDEGNLVIGTVINDYENNGKSNVVFKYEEGASSGKEGFSSFFAGNSVLENGLTASKLFRTKIIQRYHLRFNTAISYNEDHVFVLSYLIHVERITLIAKPSYHYVHRQRISLSKKKYPAERLVKASDELINHLEAIMNKYELRDLKRKQYLFTMLGLNQLVRAALAANATNMQLVGKTIRKRKKLFISCYSPNHSMVRIIPYLFFLKLDKFVLWAGQLVNKYTGK